MVELIDFLHARINEDEQTAKEAIESERSGNGTWRAKDDGTGTGLWGYVMSGHYPICGHDIGDVRMAHADHIARHDPARALREVEAKRRVLTRAQELHDDPFDNDLWTEYLTGVLPAMAAAYSNHQDYNPEWTP
ncbi:hypothetical protein C8K36_102456 [Rhodococcus sp. OK519]|uniref:DUF6221 family protein n=1 Tax=Rhodococcus sp. OK519 TaxID=2135729 RepID=UPI000D4990AD|nr:hypothetical protein C8K36_102456 [Rhodococcus sp. OK519]